MSLPTDQKTPLKIDFSNISKNTKLKASPSYRPKTEKFDQTMLPIEDMSFYNVPASKNTRSQRNITDKTFSKIRDSKKIQTKKKNKIKDSKSESGEIKKWISLKRKYSKI